MTANSREPNLFTDAADDSALSPAVEQFVRSLDASWRRALAAEIGSPAFAELVKFVDGERQSETVFPPACDVFHALNQTPLNEVRVLIVGQDPYHDDGQAHGLCFSVPRGVKIPPSLRNIFKELHSDLGIEPREHGCLTDWARQGVLLLNTVLTVRAHNANSHRKKGWEKFTDRVIQIVSEQQPRVAFVLWGKPAQKKRGLIDDRHLVIESAHPSPLSAHRGFFGSRPFSKINAFLEDDGEGIEWAVSG